MNRVLSNNVIIEMLSGGDYYPIFCGKTMVLSQSQELVEVTSINSVSDREYQAGMTNTTLEITGVTVLNNTDGRVSIAYLMQQAIRRVAQSYRIRLTDDDLGTLQITFSALVTNNTLSRSPGTYSQSATSMTVTGGITFSDIIPPPAGKIVQDPLYIDFPAGDTEVSDPFLEASGVEILEVQREGLGQDETTGTPGNRQFKFVAVDGKIQFSTDNPSNGETVYVLYQV